MGKTYTSYVSNVSEDRREYIGIEATENPENIDRPWAFKLYGVGFDEPVFAQTLQELLEKAKSSANVSESKRTEKQIEQNTHMTDYHYYALRSQIERFISEYGEDAAPVELYEGEKSLQ